MWTYIYTFVAEKKGGLQLSGGLNFGRTLKIKRTIFSKSTEIGIL
jgi:hypothetical protein